jgi:hypothetical protein
VEEGSAVKRFLAGLVVLGVAGFACFSFVSSHHLFAPPLSPLNCPSYDTQTVQWVPDSQVASEFGGQPPANTVQWLGWTEFGGCGQTLTIHAGSR